MTNYKKLLASLLAALQVAAPAVSWAQSAPATTVNYTAGSQVSTVTSPAGRVRQLQWDNLGRQVSETRSGATVGYGYNAQDRLTAVQDPRGLTTGYTRNGFGEATAQASPDTATTGFTYDLNGNLTSRTNAAGQTETRTYGVANRLTSLTLSHPTSGAVTYSYYYGPQGPEAGNLVQVSSPGLTLSFAHNLFRQTTSVSQALPGALTLTTSYGYAANGTLTSITYPSGRVVTFALDQFSRISAISSSGTTLLSGLSYSPLGVVGWAFGNGQAVSRTFDLNGRLTGISMPGGTRQYAYDVDDRIVGTTDPLLGSATYGYDDFDRLTSATTSLGAWAYSYDANGNRTGVTINGSSYAVGVDSGSNRVTASATPTLRVNTYTADGQTAQVVGGSPSTNCGPNVALGYQADGQLVTSNVLSAVHTPNGLRLQKTAAACAGGATTNFVYDVAGHLIGEYDTSGVPVQETVWLGDTPVAVFKSNGVVVVPYYIFADNLSTPRAITNAASQVVWRWDGEPFGATAADSNPSGLGVFTFNLRFPGQYYDAETGYHHNGWREYDPALGRYVQSDPIGLAGGLNTYGYADASPLDSADPSGKCPWCLAFFAPELGAAAATAGTFLLVNAPRINAIGIAIAEAWGGVGVAARASTAYRATDRCGAALGQAAHSNYKSTFFGAHPLLDGRVNVHHAIEQQVLTRYPGVISNTELHSLDNLRGIPNDLNSTLHLSVLRKDWNRFYRNNPAATKQQLLDHASELDAKYGSSLWPPK